jgi:hypothetical protein
MTYSEWFSARAILKKNEGGRYGDVFGDYIARKILLQQIYPSEKITFVPGRIAVRQLKSLKETDFLEKCRALAAEKGIDGFVLHKETPGEKQISYVCACFQLKSSSNEYPHKINDGNSSMSITNIMQKFQSGSKRLFDALKPILDWKKENMVFTFMLVSTGEIHSNAETHLHENCFDCFDRKTDADFLSVRPYLPAQLKFDESDD